VAEVVAQDAERRPRLLVAVMAPVSVASGAQEETPEEAPEEARRMGAFVGAAR
jgi:hypothetical protein